jgi:SNF2 family DNA or RNA helicase
MRSDTDLFKYQRVGVDFLISRLEGGLLSYDTGLGKTVTMLTALKKLIADGKCKKALILGTPRIAESVWAEEPHEWEHLKDISVIPINGNPQRRRELLASDPKIISMSYDLVGWLVQELKDQGIAWSYDSLILDESSMVKNHSSKRFKTLKGIRNKVDRVFCLSATPAANTLASLWTQFRLIDGGTRLHKSFTTFQNEFFYPTDYNKWNWELRHGAGNDIMERIKDITLRMSKEDYLSLPPLIHNTINVTLPEKAYTTYKQLERDFIVEIANNPIAAVNSAVLSGKLRQACNGFLYTEVKEIVQIHVEKLKALSELVESSVTPILLFYEFKADWSAIKTRFPFATHIKTPNSVRDFNDGKLRLLCGHFQSMGHGLNLQHGGNQMVFYCLPWSNEHYLQAVGRLHRQGQTETTVINYIVAKNTIDERVVESLKAKESVQQSLLVGLAKEVERLKLMEDV